VNSKIRIGTKGQKSLIVSVEIGSAVSLIVTALLSAIAASLTINGGIKEEQMKLCSFAIRMVAVFAGGVVGGGIVKEKSFAAIGLIALAYLSVLVGIGVAVYESSFYGFGSGVGSVAAGGAAACILRLKPSNNRKYVTKRKH